MIAAALLPPLVALVFIAIWRVASLFILFLRATREDRQPYTTEGSRAEAQALLEKARLEFEDEQALRDLPAKVTMNWPINTRYEDL